MMLKQMLFGLCGLWVCLPLWAIAAGTGSVTLIHLGDLHGHLIPRPNLRAGDPDYGKQVGGLAYVYDRIEEIRARKPNALLINTGDTLQGSAEALYSSGQIMVDILNRFGIDYFAIGNWDFLYGTERFRELFAGSQPVANWNALAANLYYSTLYEFPQTPYPSRAGQRVVESYAVREINGVKIGVIGLTADRGPQAISQRVMEGFTLTPGAYELQHAIPLLRDTHQVDLIVLISERGIAANLELVERYPGVDVVLSSDSHEETPQLLHAESGTLLVEEGQDGTLVGELTLTVADGRLTDYQWKVHRVNEINNQPHPEIQAMIDAARARFVKGSAFRPHVNPINAAILRTPIDSVIGFTKQPLHRANFSHAPSMPAVIEGSSHDFLTDAFRHACAADLGLIRGFRYGTHVAPGPIKLEDIYHYIPIGPQIACGLISGDNIRLMLERSADKSLNQYPAWWGGGWLLAFSGLTYDLDPNNEYGLRVSNLRVGGDRMDLEKLYRVAGYWYLDMPDRINRQLAYDINVLRDEDGAVVDATDIVAWYLRALPNHTADTPINRVRLLNPLPPRIGVNPEIQPWKGVRRPNY
jgi:sulfur-oxidizing protein SoxB